MGGGTGTGVSAKITGKRIIIPISGSMGIDDTHGLVKSLATRVLGFKFHAPRAMRFLANGYNPFQDCKLHGHKIFVDIKGLDIPTEVGEMVKDLEALGADIITVHASGGRDMLEAAVAARQRSKLLAITILTSMSEAEVKDIYGYSKNVAIGKMAALAFETGFDGTVSSAVDLEHMKTLTDVGNGKMIRCTPGIRWRDENVANDDQARVMEPKDAIIAGADWLVIGRPIIRAKEPIAAAERAEAEAADGWSMANDHIY